MTDDAGISGGGSSESRYCHEKDENDGAGGTTGAGVVAEEVVFAVDGPAAEGPAAGVDADGGGSKGGGMSDDAGMTMGTDKICGACACACALAGGAGGAGGGGVHGAQTNSNRRLSRSASPALGRKSSLPFALA